MEPKYSFDVSEQDFEEKVIEQSRKTPVVVDFWAPWCGPCRVLGPVLERAIEARGGEVLLAKVNVDQNPALAQRFEVRGIPAVKAFRGGKLAAEFVGALPEREIMRFLNAIIPSEADKALQEGEDLLEKNAYPEAKDAFARALSLKPNWPPALLGKAKALLFSGDEEEARRAIELLPEGSSERLAAEALLTQRSFIRDAQHIKDEEETIRHLAAHPDDLESRWRLASYYAVKGKHEEALKNFLEIVKRDRSFREDGARQAMLALFDSLGPKDELTSRYRRQLSMVL